MAELWKIWTRDSVPKWVWILQMPQKISDQNVCPSPKVWDFGEKRLHWAYVVGCANKDLGLFYQSPGDLKGVMIKSVITTLMSPGL